MSKAYEAKKRRLRENPEREKQVQREYAARRRGRIVSMIRASKEGRPCVDCGGIFPPQCMDYDHVRGDKRNRLAMWHTFKAIPGMTLEEVILDEIAKCELRCANCHRIRHGEFD